MSIINDWRAPAFWLQRRGGPIDLRCFCGPGRSIVRKRFARDRRQGAQRAGGTKRQRKIVGSYVLATRLSELQEKLECGTECIMKRKAGSVGVEPITRRMLWSWTGAVRAERLRTTVLRRIDRARGQLCVGRRCARRLERCAENMLRAARETTSRGWMSREAAGGSCVLGRIRRGGGDSGEASGIGRATLT